MSENIRVLIADDQAITRSGLKALLAAAGGIDIVGEAKDGAECLALTEETQPDVVLMDLRMPVLNGIEATRRIHRSQPHVGILVLTVFADDTSVFPAIRAGARGYLLKDAAAEELRQAVETVARGGAIFSPGIASTVMHYLSVSSRPEPGPDFEGLTGRERAVLEALAEGLTNAEIAERMGISSKTVSNNVSNILSKLQAVDRARLMLMALEAGMGRRGDRSGG
ncbi:MAG TPA: response regulator transcription factor [Trueperaceae bacterium]|nr:response regulator transcription factor [Trueperaceae bacterium]